MFECIRLYIASCHECQITSSKSEDLEVVYARIPLDFRPMKRFSMDVKHLFPGRYGMQYLLICTCEVSGYVEAIALRDIRSNNIATALYYNIICRYGRVTTAIMDQASYFTSDFMKRVFTSLNIKPIVVSPGNHGSLRTERYIRSMNDIMCKYLTKSGTMWPMFVKPICFAMNTFIDPITGFSPHQMVFLEDPPNPLGFEWDVEKKGLTADADTWMEEMRKKQAIMRQVIEERTIFHRNSEVVKSLRKHPRYETFCVGDIVLLHAPTASSLQAPSRKLKHEWVGPLKIHTIVDATHYKLADLNGKQMPMPIHIRRIKKYNYLPGSMSNGKLDVISNTDDLLDYAKKIENKGDNDDK